MWGPSTVGALSSRVYLLGAYVSSADAVEDLPEARNAWLDRHSATGGTYALVNAYACEIVLEPTCWSYHSGRKVLWWAGKLAALASPGGEGCAWGA